MARDGQGYFGVDVGAVFPNEYDSTVNGISDAVVTSSETGWELGGVLGYDFGVIRTELEGSYKEFNPDEISSPVVGLPGGAVAAQNNVLRRGTFVADGEHRLTSAFANALLDFGGDDSIGFSIGGGYGHVWFNGENAIASTGPGYFDDSDHTWAWQGIAALRIPASENFDVGLKYRYLNTNEFDIVDSRGRATSFDLATHSALISLILNFGGAEAPPPPPPPPPPEPEIEVPLTSEDLTEVPEVDVPLDAASTAAADAAFGIDFPDLFNAPAVDNQGLVDDPVTSGGEGSEEEDDNAG
ncbi:outer membrane beta-barrel protein [Altererythrobacter buctensis]|uniref:Outer membrane beta-barrel protein n=2 Tax=Alteraurantiacibacter buctensis TaxID=1503981 RepID=A0A844YSY9_9SPHN|nr:outer membrane beta-barrel protein [Alteraurantiacibacter buctensis]